MIKQDSAMEPPRIDEATSIPAVGAFNDLFARLDPDLRGKQFEHICKWFLTNDPVYKHELRRVWLWDEWTGRWGGDAGGHQKWPPRRLGCW
jgi:hypothetical protein